jgi:hypothetical protein
MPTEAKIVRITDKSGRKCQNCRCEEDYYNPLTENGLCYECSGEVFDDEDDEDDLNGG